MDTFSVQKFEYLRVCEFIAGGSLLLILVLAQMSYQPPIYANDLIANTVISAPNLIHKTKLIKEEFNPEVQKDKFNSRIQEKYQGYSITNIDDGIKHIKMTKYFSGRPVKINIVEINQKVANNYEVKPATASTKTLQYKTTLRTIAGRTNSIVAINGGFF